MLINNTIESSKRPGIPGPHRPDLRWFKEALDGKSDVGHVHQKEDITDFEHTHDGRYYRKDTNELSIILSGNGTPNFNEGKDGDYFIDELNGDLYKKSGDAWLFILHLKGEQGIPGPQGNPGDRGPEGPTGKEGYTPVRGTDYWTPEDEEIIRQSIVSEVQLGLSGKVDKVEGKGLSTEDFTTLLKQKLEELQNYDDRDIRELLEKALYNVTIDVKTGILTFHTIDESSFTVDLPLELLVSDGYLDNDTNTIVLVLANGNTIDIPVKNLIRDFYGKAEVDQKIADLAEEVNVDIKAINDELDEAKLEFDSRISANEQAIQNDKSEFESETVQGDSLYFDDAAERPLGLIPYGEPVQEVIEEELGNTVEGESVVVADGDVEKEVKATVNGNSYQYSTEGYNLCPTDFDDWESGDYNAGNGNKTDDVSRIRLKELLKVTPSGSYYFALNTTNVDLRFVIRCYGENKEFVSSFGALTGGTNFSVRDDVYYLGISIYNTKDLTSNLYETFKAMFENGELKPFVCLTKNSSKPFEKYTGGQASPNIEYPQEVEVVEGVNRLQIDETNWELTDNGIKGLGKVGVNTGVNLSAVDMNLKANTTYYLNFVLLSRPTNSVSFSIYIDKVANDSISFLGLEKTANYTLGKVVTKAYTPTKDEVLKVVMWGNANAEIFEFQYWITTVPNTPYLPYGHIGLVQRGKNKLPTAPEYTHTANNVEITSNGKGGYRIVAETPASAMTYFDFALDKPCTIQKGDYLHCMNEGEINNNVAIALFENSYTQIMFTTAGVKKRIVSLDDYVGRTITKFRLLTNADNTMDISATPMIINNVSTDTNFEPYIEPKTIEIDLAGNSLAKVGDIADLLKIGVDGSVKIGKNIFIEKITSSNTIAKSSYGTNCYDITLSKLAYLIEETVICAFSTHFRGIPFGDRTKGIKDSIYIPSNKTVTVRDTPFTTIEELKTFLDNNDIYVIYILKTPTTITLPSIEPITLFEGTNVFELVTNLDTTMKVEYIVNAETLQNEITELSNAVIELGGTL